MSIESRWTIGAMASKKASASSPVSVPIAAARAGEVRGPVATITLSQSAGGSPATSSRRIAINGWASSAAVTACAKPSRSTAKAPPAGTWFASAVRMISEPSRRISACSRPTALCSRSSERNEFEQTSSASAEVLWAAVVCLGRISCSTTGTPRAAICQAASAPASPPPMMCTLRCRSPVMAGKLCPPPGRDNGAQRNQPELKSAPKSESARTGRALAAGVCRL